MGVGVRTPGHCWIWMEDVGAHERLKRANYAISFPMRLDLC